MDYALTITVISTIVSGIGLFLTGIALLLNWQSLKENNKAREIQLLTNTFNAINEIEGKLYTEYKGKDKKEWDSLLFNSIEYFAFLINNRFISNYKMRSFFDDVIIIWYENIFLKH
jgi:hypothetical protein